MAAKKKPAPPVTPEEPVTLEDLLTSPAGFALTTATPVQRAICRLIGGHPLGELAQDPNVVAALGGAGALPLLAGRPLEVYLIAGIRAAKSLTAAAAAVLATQTVDLSRLGAGEVARVSVLSLSLDTAKVIYGHICGHVLAQPILKALLVEEPTADSITLRHPSGRPVEIKVVAGSKAGGTLVARWSAGAIFDEAPRMSGDEAVVNFSDARAAVLGRLLPGAQLLAIGSPWAPQGPIYDTVQERWGKPGADLVVIRAPAAVMNPVWWTPERIAAFRARPGGADLARTEIDAEFADPETALLSSVEVERATRAGDVTLPPRRGRQYAAAMDPATRGNAWTVVVAHLESGRLVIDLARQWVGSRAAPLSPRAVLAEIAGELRPYGVEYLLTDQWGFDFAREPASDAGLVLIEKTWTAASKLLAFDALRLRLSPDALELPPDPTLRADLLSVRRRVTTNGVAIHLPTTGDGRHADYAPPLALLAGEHLNDIEADRAADGFDDGEREMMAEQDQDRRDEQRLGWM